MEQFEFPLVADTTTIYARQLRTECRQPAREAEREAVDILVAEVFGNSATLIHTPDGAPHISGFDGWISISHGAGMATLAVDRTRPVGIDVEAPRAQLQRIARRFMSPKEYEVYGGSLPMMLRAWTAKEAVFKAAGVSGLTIGEIYIHADGATAEARGAEFELSFFENKEHTICVARKLRKNHEQV